MIGLQWPGMTVTLAREFLDELDMLAQTAGAQVVGRELVKRGKKDPALFVGTGKAEELAEIVQETAAELVIFDDDLAPAQNRNLERVLGVRVLDRSGLILDIFARRARTKEARTQVELAQLRYMLPRLAGAWTHLERQQGGIGMRGPGETQIETDRRIIRTRIAVLEEELLHIERVHHTQRAGRDDVVRFALAGYTNVGKSTLMNVLTGAGVYEENLLFATLDSTTRQLAFSAKLKAVLTDTVGFIRKLPPGLVASFRSTLAEIREAHFILHLVDLASPSYKEQKAEVEKILNEMKVGDLPRLTIFNKIDCLEDDVPLRESLLEHPGGMYISARNGTGIPELIEQLKKLATDQGVYTGTVRLRPEDGKLLAEIYRYGEVTDEVSKNGSLQLSFRMPKLRAEMLGLTSREERLRPKKKSPGRPIPEG